MYTGRKSYNVMFDATETTYIFGLYFHMHCQFQSQMSLLTMKTDGASLASVRKSSKVIQVSVTPSK